MTKPGLEIIRGARPAATIRAAVFDFDDTLSLLRSGWQKIMIDQAVEVLQPFIMGEGGNIDLSDFCELYQYVESYIDELTGRPTIHQMARLAQEVEESGGLPHSAEYYKDDYLARLGRVIDERARAIRSGAAPATSMQVSGADSLLKALSEGEIKLILASGTDNAFVQAEMRLLELAHYFGPHIYGAPANDPSFSKGRVLDDMIRELGIPGANIVGFGDGVVEIRETRRVGGFAIGVAKWSPESPADFARHRGRLIEAGAQAIIPDYEQTGAILSLLGLKIETPQC